MSLFYSKRNCVYPIRWQGHDAVEKCFRDSGDWKRENAVYQRLSGNLPIVPVLFSAPGVIVTKYCNQPMLLAELERQEMDGFSPEPWQVLCAWLERCHSLCGLLPNDGNLRNFLWDKSTSCVIGLDFEGYCYNTIPKYGAILIAYVLEYTPVDSKVKQQIALLLKEYIRVTDSSILAERKALLDRRSLYHSPLISYKGGRNQT